MTSVTDDIRNTLYDTEEYYVGVTLAILSTIFIGGSFVVKKKALIRIQSRGVLRAAAGGFGYLKEWLWWAGLLLMGIGEAANFAAYAFAPASLVTSLGALSIIVSAILASKFLHERLNILGKLGCLLCILGSTVIVLHSPKEETVDDLLILLEMLQAPLFLTYVAFVFLTSTVIYMYLGPKYGQRNVIVYVLLCSTVGSLSVMACKGLGLALKQTFSGTKNELDNWLTWFCLFSVVICIAIQLNYLNKALDIFSPGVVTPVYYVLFTTSVIVASSFLFREWGDMEVTDIVGSICGFLTIVIAIALLNVFRDVEVSSTDVKFRSGTREETTKRGYNSNLEALLTKDDTLGSYGIKNIR